MESEPRDDKWVKYNDDHAKAVSDRLKCGANYILIGSSHIVRFFDIPVNRGTWEKNFGPEYLSFANRGDRIENALWMINRYNLPGGCDVAVVHIGGNNIKKKSDSKEIAKVIKKVALQLHKNNNETLVLLTGTLPGKGKPIKVIGKVNHILQDITRCCKNIFYLKPVFQDWANNKGGLKEELDFGDHLHWSNAGYQLFTRYIAEISQLSEKFKNNCVVPYVAPMDDTTLRYGITEPSTFYTTDSDPGVARGKWKFSPPSSSPPPPHFNKVPCTTSSSESGVAKCIGLPGTHVVNHLGGSVVHGGFS